jgi:hypothetical protein
MKFQAKFLKVSGVQDSQGDKYTQVQLRLFHKPDPNKQVETTEHVSMFLMGLLYQNGNVIVEIAPEDEVALFSGGTKVAKLEDLIISKGEM